MNAFFEDVENTITEVSRKAIADYFGLASLSWSGGSQDGEFLARLYDLSKLPSKDYRYKDAAGDIYQHCVRNRDWDRDWVFYDNRFNLLRSPDNLLARVSL